MCRVLSYLGKPILIEELLYKPDNSFIKQSYHPIYMTHLLNLAGFGMAAWNIESHNPEFPFLYKTPYLPFYDENLRNLSSKIMPHCLLAHLRGVAYNDKQVISIQNVHPFSYPETNLILAHNGALYDFKLMRYDLLEYIDEQYKKEIKGTTDSEWIYYLLLSQLAKSQNDYETKEIISAVFETITILQFVRRKNKIRINSPVNLFITNGKFIAATRFVLDYGWFSSESRPSTHTAYHSLWYTYGESYGLYEKEYRMKGGDTKSSIIIASEPLTEDATTWLEVPEYTLIVARHMDEEIRITSQDINL